MTSDLKKGSSKLRTQHPRPIQFYRNGRGLAGQDLYSWFSNYIVGYTTMLKNKQAEVLASYFPRLKEKTAKEIEKSMDLSHEPVFRLLKSLVKDRYLSVRSVGKTKLYEVVFNDETYFVYAYYMTKKANEFKYRHELLYKRLKEYADIIKSICTILFGSYSKGTETSKSDIDVLVVSDSIDAEKKANVFKTKYNMEIKPVVVKPHDFKNIKIENKAFYNDLVEFGIVFDGLDFFFKEVYGKAT